MINFTQYLLPMINQFILVSFLLINLVPLPIKEQRPKDIRQYLTSGKLSTEWYYEGSYSNWYYYFENNNYCYYMSQSGSSKMNGIWKLKGNNLIIDHKELIDYHYSIDLRFKGSEIIGQGRLIGENFKGTEFKVTFKRDN